MSAGLNQKQIEELAKLDTGVAAIKQGEWLETVLCKVNKYEPVENKSGSICQSDKKSNYKSIGNIEETITALILNRELSGKMDRVDEFREKMIRSKLRTRACLKIKNCTKHVFLSPFHDRIKKKGAFICQDVMN